MVSKPSKGLLVGAHISIAQGIDKAAERAKKQGCEIMQIFVQSPQTYKTPPTSAKEIEKFKFSLKKNLIKEVYAHTPYLINLASPNNRIRYASISLVKRNLVRASALGCRYLVTHIGSYGSGTKAQGVKHSISALTQVLSGYVGTCQLLLELSAGSGHLIGDRFEEIHKLSTALKSFKIGVCLDTAHIFASGYDLRGYVAINKTLEEFDTIIGLKNLKLIHINDSKAPLGSRKDRHANLGEGSIGLDNFKILINHLWLRDLNFILETPGNINQRLRDICLLKSFRG